MAELQVPGRTTTITRLGLEPVIGDPNDTSPHTDVIKQALIAKSKDTNVSEREREQARKMLDRFYPFTPPADPNRWQGQGNIAGGVITNTKGTT